MSTSLQALVVVVLLTAAMPWLQRPLGGRIPTIILYLMSGILVGPALLGWIQPDPVMDILRKLALAAVFTVIGYEFNMRDLAGPMGRLACVGWLASVLSGLALVLCLPISGLARSLALVLPVSASALPNMKFTLLGSGEWEKPLGKAALTAGILGQVGPVLALTLLLSTQLPQFTLGKLAVLILFGLCLGALPAWLARRGISLPSPSAQECYQLILVLFVGILALCVSLGVDILFGGLLAGVVFIRARGVYFALITFGLAQVVFKAVYNTRELGGSDGIIGVPQIDVPLGLLTVSASSPGGFFLFTLIFVMLLYGFLAWWMRTPLGRLLVAVRVNESRVPFLGFAPWRVKLAAFVMAAIVAALCGALYPMLRGLVSPELLTFQTSGNAVIMVILGGVGTLIGPLYGAALLTGLKSVIGTWTEHHLMIIGALFMLSVIFLPKGFAGAVLPRLRRYFAGEASNASLTKKDAGH